MRVLVLGAGGFIGQALITRLLASGIAGQPSITSLVLCDQHLPATDDPRVRGVAGDFSNPAILDQAMRDPVDIAFQLAAIPGGAAERDYALGKRINIDGTFALIEALRKQGGARFVMTSSIAVFGADMPSHVDDDTPAVPGMSYGAQKLMTEILLDDLARRGDLDARVVRLPGILARPPAPTGHISAYMSDVFHAIAKGEKLTCPVSRSATAWFMSVTRCVDNLVHAASIDTAAYGATRVCTLPALVLTMDALVSAIGHIMGRDTDELISYAPIESVEALFGRSPPLSTPRADALGFRHDGTAQELVARALRHAGYHLPA